ncbi:UNVERIFIED_CONTAM: hypothetical protein Sindi_2033100 [Sesamum indicum]
MSTAQRDRRAAFEAGKEEGKEEGFGASHEVGLDEGRISYLKSSKFQNAISQARLKGVHGFMKSRAFQEVVESMAASFMIEGFDKCQYQIQKLQGFAEGFGRSQLDPALDGNLEPYPAEEEAPPPPLEDEFAVLLEENEPGANPHHG